VVDEQTFLAGGGGSGRLAFQARARAWREATDEWLENGEPAERTRNEVEWPTVRVDAADLIVLLQRPEPGHYLAKRGTLPKKVYYI